MKSLAFYKFFSKKAAPCSIFLSFLGGLMISCTSYATEWNGIYLGANLGIEHSLSHYRFRDFIMINQPKMHIIDFSRPNIGEIGAEGGLSLGVGKRFEQKYIGVELQLNYSPLSIINNGSSSAFVDVPGHSQLISEDIHDVRLKNDYAALLVGKLGWLWTDATLTYILFGAGTAYFKGEVTASGQVLKNDGGYFIAEPYRHHFAKNKIGPVLGLGIETAIKNNLFLHAEYSFSYFGTLNNADFTEINYIDQGQLMALRLEHEYQFKRISRGFFSIGLVYRFLRD